MFEEVVKLNEAALGRQHPVTIATVANLGVNYKDASRIEEAIPLLEEAFEASEKEPSLAWVGQKLLEAYTTAIDAGKPEGTYKVITLIRKLLADARVKLPKDSPQLAGQLASFSQTLIGLKAWDEAEPLVRECLAIREKAQPDDWRTFNSRSMLGGVLLGQKKFSEAESLLLEGHNGMKERETAIPAQGKKNIQEALKRLIELYTAWHVAKPN